MQSQCVLFQNNVRGLRPICHAGSAGEAARARLQAPLLLQCVQAHKAAFPESHPSAFQAFMWQHAGVLGVDALTMESLQVQLLSHRVVHMQAIDRAAGAALERAVKRRAGISWLCCRCLKIRL